jgi:hypothetical protein
MAAVVSLPEQRMILWDISWKTYELLLADHENQPGIRFSYDQGRLEVVKVSSKPENYNRRLAIMVDILTEEMGIDLEGFGSTRFNYRS